MNPLLTIPGVDGAWLAKAAFEANLLLLFGICLVHSARRHGWERTGREFGAGFLMTALAESTGVLSGAYVYPGFQLYVWATPVGNPASWVALVYCVMTVSDRLVFGRDALLQTGPGSRRLAGLGLLPSLALLALCDGVLALILDLVLDPMATLYNWWIWVPHHPGVTTITAGVVDPYNFDHLVWMATPDNPVAAFFAPFFEEGRYPTRLLGIPLINFVAWLVFVTTVTFQLRWVEGQADWTGRRKTAVLAAFVLISWPVLSLLLITPNL